MSGGDHQPQDAYAAYATAMGIDTPWSDLSEQEQSAWLDVVAEVTGQSNG
jgi:hypothetical protein